MDLSVSLPGIELKNPIIPASGCFGVGREYSQFYDLGILGAVILKAPTGEMRLGNPTPREAKTATGMLNANSFQNPGFEKNIETEIPFLNQYDTSIIANVAGSKVEEYEFVAETLNQASSLYAIELNISCPNVKEGGIQFGIDPDLAYEL